MEQTSIPKIPRQTIQDLWTLNICPVSFPASCHDGGRGDAGMPVRTSFEGEAGRGPGEAGWPQLPPMSL